MKRYITLILIAVFAVSAYSQNVPQQRTCGHTAHQHALMQDADYAQAHYERQIRFDNMELQVSIEGRAQCANPTVLPMAVHFEGINNPNTACLVALAQQQIQILNDDYAGTNADITNWTNNAASSFPGVNNGEACIAFCLATNNHPAGYGLTEGQPAVTINQFTGDNAPAFSGYINIFVRNIQGGILGYSPLGGQGNGDGVTIGTSFFSSGAGCTGVSPQAPFNLGRTLTHELGHYLNLNHIWGDGPCGADDGVADTPLDDNPNYNCPSVGISSCGTTDMHMNYMDYVNDACMYMFSDGQAARMENYVASNLQNVANNYATVCNVVPVAPTADFSASPSTGCAPLATSFTDNSGGSPTSWSWSFPGGTPAISSAQNPSVTYNSPGTYTATLTASNAQGSDVATMSVVVNDCSNLTCTQYDNLNNGTIILLDNPATGQAAGGYVAGHNGYGDAAKADYFTGIPANTQIDGVEFDFGFATGTGNVEFAIWADNGGTPGAELFTQTIPVSTIIADVNANNNTTIDFGGLINAPSSFFVGVKLEYGTHEIALNTNTDGDTNPTTAWELWGDNSWHPYNDGTGTNTTWEFDMAHAIYPNICSQSTTPQAPTANFSSSTVSQGCETIQIQYTDNSSNNPTSWSWTFPGGSPASSTMQNPVVAYTSAGTYNASLTATNAVGSNSTTQNGVTTVPSPISGSGTASTNTIDIGTMSGLVNFTGTSAGATSWSWDFGDGGSSTMQNPSHTYNAVGTYTVTLTVTDGFCTETITVGTIVVNDTTDIEDIVGLNSMSIYPNPVSGTFYIELVSDQSLELQVEIFDAVGRKVMNGGVINVMGNTIQSMDGSNLSAGTYFVRITNGTNTATTKFLKF